MPPIIESKHLNGVVILRPHLVEDERGFFMEVYREDHFRELGIAPVFRQDNHSRSAKGVLRGLHFQWDPPQGKLVRVTLGRAFYAAVDIRKGSPTLGRWISTELSAEEKKFIYVPPGFASGFCVLSEFAEVQYKCTDIYNAACEGSILWNDPAIGIRWPVERPTVSRRDDAGMTLEAWLASPAARAFTYPATAE